MESARYDFKLSVQKLFRSYENEAMMGGIGSQQHYRRDATLGLRRVGESDRRVLWPAAANLVIVSVVRPVL